MTYNFNFPIILEQKSAYTYQFGGYASIFNNIDMHNDIVLPFAFNNLDNSKILPVLWQHNANYPIGRIMSLKKTSRGLYVLGRIFTQLAKAKDALDLISSKSISGMSIGYEAKNFYHNHTGQRILTDINLFEVSIVTFPANDLTRIDYIESTHIPP